MKKPLLILLAFLVLLVAVKSYWNHLISAPDPNSSQTIDFVIDEGQSLSDIAENLQNAGLIRSPKAFIQIAKTSGLASRVKAGNFRLSPSMDATSILKELTVGTAGKTVTLVEGWRVEQMADRLQQQLGVKREDFIKVAKEGYMFPDTYAFNSNMSAKDIATTMQDNFQKKYNADLRRKIKQQGLTLDEGVILASLVEREGRSDEVRTNIAGILLKRLKIGMPLNVDATIQYALGYQSGEKGWWKRRLTFDDLKVESSYNTYTNSGLPPGPICSPGFSSLNAVANADSTTPYLYYYHDSQGNSYYSKTLEEHNINVANHP